MAVNLTLSEQQASLLIPLLQQMAGATTGINIDSSVGVTTPMPALNSETKSDGKDPKPSTSDSPPQSAEVQPNDSPSKLCSSYSPSELLQKKRKNTKSSEAQNCLHVSN